MYICTYVYAHVHAISCLAARPLRLCRYLSPTNQKPYTYPWDLRRSLISAASQVTPKP